MKQFKHLIWGIVMVVGLSLTGAAQRNGDQKKPPPKEGRPPKIEPKQEKPPPRNPREGDKPNKPGYAYLIPFVDEKYYLT